MRLYKHNANQGMLFQALYLGMLGCASALAVLLMHTIGASAPFPLQVIGCWFVSWVSIDLLFVHQSMTLTRLASIDDRLGHIERRLKAQTELLTQSASF